MKKFRAIAVGLLLGVLTLGLVADFAAQAQQGGGGPGPGARGLLRSFFQAMGSGDLALLKNGAAISGSVQGDEFVVNLESGEAQTIARADIATISFGEPDQLLLTAGETLRGSFASDSLDVVTSSGNQLTIAKEEIQLTIFQLNLPQPGQNRRPDPQLFQIFQGLQAQNIFGLFAQALTTFDMAVFPNGQIWSGVVLNEQISFTSTIFGTLTVNAADLSSIQFASEEGESDFISLKTGDRLSGTIAEDTLIQFQPAGLVDENGAPVTLTLEGGGSIRQVNFRQPASAFGGGGRGPGLGGGPGN